MSLRNWTFPALLLAVPGAAAISPSRAAAQGTSPSTPAPPEVKVAATAERVLPPDLARVSFTFVAEAPARPELTAKLAATVEAARKALIALGVPRDSLFTGSQWYWWNGRIETRVGEPHLVPGPGDPVYRPTRMARDTVFKGTDAIEAHVSDLAKLGAVIDAAIAAGATNVSNIRYSARNVTAAQEDALREATQRARSQATAIAQAAGGTLGALLGISTERDGSTYRGYEFPEITSSLSGMSVQEAGPGTQITAPVVTIKATVYVRWELKTKP